MIFFQRSISLDPLGEFAFNGQLSEPPPPPSLNPGSAPILMALDSRKCVILLLLDLSAAFDTVDHEILLRRLHCKFGIKGKAHAWLRSCLTVRTQFVRITGTNSSVHYLKYGVPQGSVVGPLLYLLY